MDKKFYKNEKFQKTFYALLYFALAITFVITGTYVFNNLYYTSIYVSGGSMMPTLVGNTSRRVHYGISDNHEKTLRNLQRFDVVITYYPWNVPSGGDEVYKIKRVWGFPGETISLTYSVEAREFTFSVKDGERVKYSLTAPVVERDYPQYDFNSTEKWQCAEFNVGKKTFYTHVGEVRQFELTLDKDNQEYFLMGDNWGNSTDSYSHRYESKRITFSELQGKVVSIQGTARVVPDGQGNTELVDKEKISAMYYF